MIENWFEQSPLVITSETKITFASPPHNSVATTSSGSASGTSPAHAKLRLGGHVTIGGLECAHTVTDSVETAPAVERALPSRLLFVCRLIAPFIRAFPLNTELSKRANAPLICQ